MYPVSNDYKAEIVKNNPVTRITGTLTLKSGSVVQIANSTIAKAPSIMNQCVNNQELKLGQAYQAQLDVSIYSNINRYSIYGAEIKLFFGLKIGNAWEDVPLGVYYVSECNRTSNDVLQITALDAMGDLNDKYAGLILTGTPYELLSYIATEHGLTLGQTEEEIEALPNGTTVFGTPENYRSETWRDIVGDIAAVMAGNVIIDREGKLFIQSFATVVTRTLPASMRSRETISDYLVCYSSASCSKKGTFIAVGNDTAQDLSLDDNDFIQLGTDETTRNVLTNILEAIEPLEYTPSDISWYGDPALDLGDLIEATGGAASTSTLIPLQKFKWTWRGAHQIVAVGKNPNLGEAKSLTDKKMAGMLSQIDSKTTRYYTFVNPGSIEGITEEELIASFFFATVEDTTVTVWHEIQLDCTLDDETEPMQVIVHYYLNGVEEAYTPIQTIGESGAHTLDYNYFLAGMTGGMRNEWTVKVECVGGSADIAQKNIHICLCGQGLVGEEAFLGIIEVSEEMPLFVVKAIEACAFTDTVTLSLNTAEIIEPTDNFTIPSVATIDEPDFTEAVTLVLEIDESYMMRCGDGFYVGDDMATGGYNTLYDGGTT